MRWFDGYGGERQWYPAEQVCRACVHAEAVALKLGASGIPARYAMLRWDSYVPARAGETPQQARARAGGRPVVTSWLRPAAALLRAWDPEAINVALLVGPVGGGKSSLAATAAVESLHAGRTVRWVGERDLLAIGADWNRRKEFMALCDTDLLVIDDLGSTTSRTGREADALEEVISRRYNAVFPLLITSNLPLEGPRSIADVYGDRVLSRLYETACVGMSPTGYHQIVGCDWRTGRDHAEKE